MASRGGGRHERRDKHHRPRADDHPPARGTETGRGTGRVFGAAIATARIDSTLNTPKPPRVEVEEGANSRAFALNAGVRLRRGRMLIVAPVHKQACLIRDARATYPAVHIS